MVSKNLDFPSPLLCDVIHECSLVCSRIIQFFFQKHIRISEQYSKMVQLMRCKWRTNLNVLTQNQNTRHRHYTDLKADIIWNSSNFIAKTLHALKVPRLCNHYWWNYIKKFLVECVTSKWLSDGGSINPANTWKTFSPFLRCTHLHAPHNNARSYHNITKSWIVRGEDKK